MGSRYDGEAYDYVYPYVKNKLVFDVGSNIGEVTKKFIHAGARVVAIEPQRRVTVGKNYKGVHAIKNICISDDVNPVPFYLSGKSSTISTCFEDWKLIQNPNIKWREITMQATTLDNLIEEFGKPTYIKVDVEGYEHKVLGGLSQRIDFISLEFTANYWETFSESMKIVENLGFNKMITFQKKKIKGTVHGVRKTLQTYKIVDEFHDVKSIIEFFKRLPDRMQGDVLIEAKEG